MDFYGHLSFYGSCDKCCKISSILTAQSKILQKDIMKSGKTNKQVQGPQKGEILNKTCSVNFAEFSLLEVIPTVLQTLTV